MRADGVQLQMMAPVGHRSPTVTAVSLPEGLNGPNIVRAM
jgi:aspartate aminotransferase-like enzyme